MYSTTRRTSTVDIELDEFSGLSQGIQQLSDFRILKPWGDLHWQNLLVY